MARRLCRRLLGAVAVCQCFLTVCTLRWQRPHHHRSHHRHGGSRTRLHAYGDPDTQLESTLYRAWQGWLRTWDNLVFPHDPDVPGLTFPTPIEWAPWMETVWMGNYYDYRAAFFSDVMYSNNVPGKEGALLYRDPARALQMALLYQRYKRFDQASYATQNATFYNVFAADAVRVGRYKVPQGDSELVLCVTDPLTFSELRRYLNSIHALKWLHNKGMQQTRKRQYVLRMDCGGITSSSSSSSSTENKQGEQQQAQAQAGTGLGFFRDAVDILEWGRILRHDKYATGRARASVPVVPPAVDPTTAIGRDGAGLVVPMATANSQYFLEAMVQAVVSYLVGDPPPATPPEQPMQLPEAGFQRPRIARGSAASLAVLVGGDGRTLTPLAVEATLRVGAGNGVGSVVVAKDGVLTTAAAVAVLRGRLSDRDRQSPPPPEASEAVQEVAVTDVALVFTAGGAAAGLRGSFGIRAVVKETPVGPGSSGTTTTAGARSRVRALGPADWAAILATLRHTRTAHVLPARPAVMRTLDTLSKTPQPCGPGPTAVRVAGATRAHAAALAATFDVPALKTFLAGGDTAPLVVFDCAHAPAATRFVAQHLVPALGLDAATCVLRAALPAAFAAAAAGVGTDFNGQRPAAEVAACPEAAELFCLPRAVREPRLAAMRLQQWADAYYQEAQEAPEGRRAAAADAPSTVLSMITAAVRDDKNSDGAGDDGGSGAAPDVGFVVDADAGRCLVLAPGLAVTATEQLQLFDAALGLGWLTPEQHTVSGEDADGDGNEEEDGGSDGARTVLKWLTVLRAAGTAEGRAACGLPPAAAASSPVGVVDVLQALVWARHGRRLRLRAAVGVGAAEAVELFKRLIAVGLPPIDPPVEPDASLVLAASLGGNEPGAGDAADSDGDGDDDDDSDDVVADADTDLPAIEPLSPGVTVVLALVPTKVASGSGDPLLASAGTAAEVEGYGRRLLAEEEARLLGGQGQGQGLPDEDEDEDADDANDVDDATAPVAASPKAVYRGLLRARAAAVGALAAAACRGEVAVTLRLGAAGEVRLAVKGSGTAPDGGASSVTLEFAAGRDVVGHTGDTVGDGAAPSAGDALTLLGPLLAAAFEETRVAETAGGASLEDAVVQS